MVVLCPGSKQGIRAVEQEISAKTTSSSSGSVSSEGEERSSRLQGLGCSASTQHLMGQHDRDFCCSILQLVDPCHIPDKPLKQELTLPGCCQQRNHLSSSDSSAIRLLSTLPKCEGDLMLSVPDQSAVTELCCRRGPQRFQIICRSPSKPRIFILYFVFGKLNVLEHSNCFENHELMAFNTC